MHSLGVSVFIRPEILDARYLILLSSLVSDVGGCQMFMLNRCESFT